jgi:hypothetical protein
MSFIFKDRRWGTAIFRPVAPRNAQWFDGRKYKIK